MIPSEKRYENFETGNGYYLASSPRPTVTKLPSGVYELVQDPKTGQVYFKKTKNTHDTLIDLPSDAYRQVVTEIENFVKPETRLKFKQRGFVYKRSSLLHGLPGTGKTCIANRVCQTVVSMGGVVIQNPDPRLLAAVFDQLDYIQPETLVLVVFEEMDKLAERHEEALLNILDGEIQKDNIVYIGTTNYINKVPARIKRPGRFSSVIEVPFPKAPERDYFLKAKAPDLSDIERADWVSKTEGLSIDEVTECLRSVLCLGYSLDEIVKRFVQIPVAPVEESEEDSEDVDWEKEEAAEMVYKVSINK
jgi:SpoVK/Ycf46/Vps4 family AAA+-type ATPase